MGFIKDEQDYKDIKEIITKKSVEISALDLPKQEAIERFQDEVTSEIWYYIHKNDR